MNILHIFDNQVISESLPQNVRISTMSILCKCNLLFDVRNLGTYIALNKNNIVSKKSKFVFEHIIPKKNKKSFHNQITFDVLIDIDRGVKKKINIKLFKNGTVHLTGCSSPVHFVNSLCILFSIIKKTNYHYNKYFILNNIINNISRSQNKIPEIKTDDIGNNYNLHIIFNYNDEKKDLFVLNNISCTITICIVLYNDNNFRTSSCGEINKQISQTQIVEQATNIEPNSKINFVSDITKLNVDHIYDINVIMITSNFALGYKVNRDILYKLLIINGNNDKHLISVSYDPKHAGVIIKYRCINYEYRNSKINIIPPLKKNKEKQYRDVSIFIFESGSIIITGANNCYQIGIAYEFINKFLSIHINEIKKKNYILI